MDLSALIFVALAGAWAVYLVPKALKAHEVDEQTRSVDSFSDRMRVLARREAVSGDRAELVVEGEGRTTPSVDELEKSSSSSLGPRAESSSSSASEKRASAYRDAPVRPSKVQLRLQRARAAEAAARRRRVLGWILTALAATCVAAGFGVIGWLWVAVPSTLLVAWLVACRLMVKRERAARAPQRVRKKRRTLADEVLAEEEAAAPAEPGTEEIPSVAEEAPAKEGGWDPVPITLPTYVAKETVGRTVRTIDLDATGVWSSGRNEADSQLAREAEAAEKAAEQAAEAEVRRASGS